MPRTYEDLAMLAVTLAAFVVILGLLLPHRGAWMAAVNKPDR
jgi:hypothetical protein